MSRKVHCVKLDKEAESLADANINNVLHHWTGFARSVADVDEPPNYVD